MNSSNSLKQLAKNSSKISLVNSKTSLKKTCRSELDVNVWTRSDFVKFAKDEPATETQPNEATTTAYST